MIAALFGKTDTPLPVIPGEPLPSYITDIFQRHHFNPKTLPSLPSSDKHIVFMHPMHMSSPVMLLKDKEDITGLALHVKLRDGKSLPSIKSNHESVLAVFKKNGLWKANNQGILQYALSDRHGDVFHLPCNSCPFKEEEPIDKKLLLDLFTGMDEDFQLGGDPSFTLLTKLPETEAPPSFLSFLRSLIPTP
jgi:hypothetical protein